MFGFTLPFTLGTFYYAWKVWELHWLLAALIAAPGLLFMALFLPMALLSDDDG